MGGFYPPVRNAKDIKISKRGMTVGRILCQLFIMYTFKINGVIRVEIKFNHIPVMLEECIDSLNINPDGVYVDGTMGGAGHSFHIAKRLSKKGLLIGVDRDEEALEVAKERLKEFDNVIFVHDNHDNIKEVIEKLKIDKVDGILLDLGVSSYQIDEKTRGFTYMQDGPLDMRMDKSQTLTAEDVINDYKEEELARIIYEYGEEKFSRRIAKNICEYRQKSRITTTSELVSIIEKSIPKTHSDKQGHPAKRTFQAIRIEVNDEIKPLYSTVKNSIECLKSEGRLAIITFHSLEDRAVKQAYIDSLGKCTCPPGLPYCVCGNKADGKVITKKPILPNDEEMECNSRSRSAKLRVFEKI